MEENKKNEEIIRLKKTISRVKIISMMYDEQISSLRMKKTKTQVKISDITKKRDRVFKKLYINEKKLIEKNLKFNFKNYKISCFKMIDSYGIDGTTLIIRTKDIKLMRRNIGKYNCCIDFKDNMKLTIVSDYPVKKEYDHPHIINKVPCLGSYAGMYEQIRKEFNSSGFNKMTLIKLLMFLQKYLTEYNDESPHMKYKPFIDYMLQEKRKRNKKREFIKNIHINIERETGVDIPETRIFTTNNPNGFIISNDTVTLTANENGLGGLREVV